MKSAQDSHELAGDLLDHEKIPSWPPLKKALWDVVTSEKLNDGHYINAYDLTDKLYAAASPPAPSSGTLEALRKALSWYDIRPDVNNMKRVITTARSLAALTPPLPQAGADSEPYIESEPGEHQEVLDALAAHNSGEEQ